MSRISTKLPRAITAPPSSVPILTWYKGIHDTAFCILHPFTRVEPGYEALFGEDRDDDVDPTREDLKRHSRPVSWVDVCRLSGIKEIGQLNRLLLDWIGALGAHNEPGVEELLSILELHHLLPPDEGDFSPHLLDDFLRSIADQGYEEVVVGDEFGAEETRWRIRELLLSRFPFVEPAHPTLYPVDESMLYAVHWDSFFTVLAGDPDRVQSIVRAYRLEGFFCDDTTEVFWGKGLSPTPSLWRP